MKNKIRDMIECSMLTALLCIFAPLAVPVGTIPVTMSLFAVIICALVLGARKATIAVCIYLMLGTVGLPVFSMYRSGLPVLLGPGGGYIWSYIPVALIIGAFVEFGKNRLSFCIAGVVTGIIVCYLCGTLQFMLLSDVSFFGAVSVCVLPFVFFDAVKAFFALMLGRKIRKKYMGILV